MRSAPVIAAFAALAALALVVARPSPARADDEDDARAAMRRGVAAFGRGDAEAALAEYETAKRLAPQANAPYRYAAEACLVLGRFRDAVANLEAYLAKTPSVSDAVQVREKIGRIKAEHYLARLRVDAAAPGATVKVDDEAKGPPGRLEIAPGRHHVEVSAPGFAPSAEDVTLVGEQETVASFKLEPEQPAPPPSVPSPSTSPSPSPWRTVGWIATGVGAATLVTTFIVDVAVLGPKVSDYQSAADRGDESARGLRDDAEGLRTGVFVGYVAGGLLAAGGAALILFAPPTTRSARLRILPTVAPSRAGVVGAFAF